MKRTTTTTAVLTMVTLIGGSAFTVAATTEPTEPTEPAGSSASTAPGGTAGGADDGTLEVPAEYGTIQGAVDAALPGDLVLVSPGTYYEAVDVTTDEVTIRGLDRNEVVLDGEFELDNAVRVLGASGIAVENMTAQNYTTNGFFWTGVTGYRGSYLTALHNGDYGLYAFDSVEGQFDHSYAAGSPDAGFYIGQCFECDAVITDVVSEYNGLGYSGTNSGGDLFIVNSRFNNNRAGIVPNSGSYELCYPERQTTIAGNLVYDNNEGSTPAIDVAILAMGNGILVAGGVQNTIVRNRVWDHDKTGIGLVPFLEEDPTDDMPTPEEWDVPCADQKNEAPAIEVPGALLWQPQRNEVTDNVVTRSGTADVAVSTVGTDVSTLGNCFSGNELETTSPTDLEGLAPCGADGNGGDWTAGAFNVAEWLAEVDDRPPSVDYTEATFPDPGPQHNMPDAPTASPDPAVDGPDRIDLASVQLPDAPDDVESTTVAGTESTSRDEATASTGS